MHMMSTTSEVIEQGGCFVGNTFVATADGAVKIKDLKKGTLVYSWLNNKYVVDHY